MSTYDILRMFFRNNPESATALTAALMEVILESDDSEKERMANFLRGVRTTEENERLLNSIQKVELKSLEILNEELEVKTSNRPGSISFDTFPGSSEERAYLENFYRKNGAIKATFIGACCEVTDESSKIIGGTFIDNGRSYKAIIENTVIEKCYEEDDTPLGCNYDEYFMHKSTYKTEEIVWKDGLNFSPPPEVPPAFEDGEPEFWDNDVCKLFEGGPGPGESYPISSDFGWRRLTNPLRSDFHEGVDIAVGAGTEVLSVTTGTITDINTTAANGNRYVVVRTGNIGRKYLHIDPSSGLSVGDSVQAGQVLGVISAETPEVHLHFSVHDNPSSYTNAAMNDANARVPCPSQNVLYSTKAQIEG